MQPEEEDDPPNRRTVSACEKGLARPRRVRSPGWRDMPLRHAAEAPMSDVNSGTGRRTGTRRGLPRSASRDDGPDASLLAMTISKVSAGRVWAARPTKEPRTKSHWQCTGTITELAGTEVTRFASARPGQRRRQPGEPRREGGRVAVGRGAGDPFSFTAYRRKGAAGRDLGIVRAPFRVDHATLMKGNVIGCLTTVYDSARFGKVETPPGLRPLARAPPHGRRGERPRRGARRLRVGAGSLSGGRRPPAAPSLPPAPFGASATTPSPASAAGPRTAQAPARIGRRARPPAPPS